MMTWSIFGSYFASRSNVGILAIGMNFVTIKSMYVIVNFYTYIYVNKKKETELTVL